MNLRTSIGLMLIFGAIVQLGGWLSFFGAVCSSCSVGDSASFIEATQANVGLTKLLVSIATIGMLVLAAGLSGLRDSMAGGPGALYAKVGVLVYLIGTAAAVGESALFIGAAEAGGAGNQAIAETLIAAQGAIGSAGVGTYFLGFAAIGVGIFVQNNLNTLLSGLMIVLGMFGAFLSVYDYGSNLMIVPYLSHAILSIAAGILFLRSQTYR